MNKKQDCAQSGSFQHNLQHRCFPTLMFARFPNQSPLLIVPRTMTYLTSLQGLFLFMITWLRHFISMLRGKAFKRLFTDTLFLNNNVFSGQVECSYFSAHFSLKIFLYYSKNYNCKRKNLSYAFCGLFIF